MLLFDLKSNSPSPQNTPEKTGAPSPTHFAFSALSSSPHARNGGPTIQNTDSNPQPDLRTYLTQQGATLTLDPAAGTITVDTDLPPELIDQLRDLKPQILGSLDVTKLDSTPVMPAAGPGACLPEGHGLPWTGEVVEWAQYRFPMGDGRVALGHWAGSEWRWSVWPNGPRTVMSRGEFAWLLKEWGLPAPVYPASAADSPPPAAPA